jgi:hypothetical protein
LWQSNFQVQLTKQVAVARHCDANELVELGGGVKGDVLGLHAKIRVASIDLLKKRRLGVAGQINVLTSLRDEL